MTQLLTKFIAPNAVDGSKLRLANNETLRSRNAANSADVNIIKLTASDIPEFQVLPTVNAALAIPTSGKQLATIEYILNYVDGKRDAKDSVNLLADVNVVLTGSTTLTVDSVVVLNGMRVALTGQTTASQNGVYDAAISGANWTLTRSADFDQAIDAGGTEVTQGAYFFVMQGAAYTNFEAVLTTVNPIVIGTTALVFARIGGSTAYIGGDMITLTGATFSVDLGTNGGLESTVPGGAAGQLRVKTNIAALEKDRTAQLDVSGFVTAKKSKKAAFTLAAGDITNQFVDLVDVAADSSVILSVVGGGLQVETTDYTVNYTGGTGSKTRLTFAGGLATAGASALVATDVLNVSYTAF